VACTPDGCAWIDRLMVVTIFSTAVSRGRISGTWDLGLGTSLKNYQGLLKLLRPANQHLDTLSIPYILKGL